MNCAFEVTEQRSYNLNLKLNERDANREKFTATAQNRERELIRTLKI